MFKTYLRDKLPAWFLPGCVLLSTAGILAGCATNAATEKKYHFSVETGLVQPYPEMEQLFDEAILAFHQTNYQLAQMNLSQIIEFEKDLPDKKYTPRAREYLLRIEAIEPEAIPRRLFSGRELAERTAKREVEREIEKKLSKKTSLEFRDSDLKELISGFSASYGLNIVCDKDVQGRVSVKLKDVTVEEALKAILSISGYRYVRRGDIIYVESLSKGRIFRIFDIGYIDAAVCKEIAGELLSGQGTIKIDERFNRLVVTDLPANIEEIETFIENFDSRIPQVLIEAKIVDITVTDLQELGLQWGGTYTDNNLFQSKAGDDDESIGGTFVLGAPGVTSLPLTQFDIAGALVHAVDLSLKIDALISNQKADLLANPKIIAQNNQEARIIIGEKVPYKEKTQTTTGTTETTKFIDVGITLRVIPRISNDNYVTMAIHPEVSSVTSLIDNQPRIDTREADTVVTVKDEQTIAIGGLLKKTTSVVKRKIPILGDLPVLGMLFQSKGENEEIKELVVFITPHIIRYYDKAKNADAGSR
ncbi:MAG: secretin and TonB N-terminal domain-containing protein [Candidatus Omnitrophota bacterium]|nr:secretin and TonB N-terminal domain-containing protein [Candidatus Omnitrophota bacterium]